MAARKYDLVMTHGLDTDGAFLHRVQERCAAAGLDFFLIEPLWAEAFLKALDEGAVLPRTLINLHSEHHDRSDVFSRLVDRAEALGVRMIDPPSIARACFDKAAMHHRLVEAGIAVPPTILLPAAQAAGWRPTRDESCLLGSPFVVKPSLGYGRKGVVLDAMEAEDVARSMAAWPDPCLLLQRKIIPRMLGDQPAYFRAYYIFGRIWFCWWNCFSDLYREVDADEWSALQLEPLREITLSIARITGMGMFSTEIALSDSDEFVVIDYVNDQIHLLTQSSNPAIGVPDAVVLGIADALVDVVLGKPVVQTSREETA